MEISKNKGPASITGDTAGKDDFERRVKAIQEGLEKEAAQKNQANLDEQARVGAQGCLQLQGSNCP